MARLVDRMKDGMALDDGCWRPRPPLARDNMEIVLAWAGRECTPRIVLMKLSIMESNLVVNSLDQLCHNSGRSSWVDARTSEAKR